MLMLSCRGDKFRPAYRTVGRLRSIFDKIPLLMLTATLPETTALRVLDILHFTTKDICEVYDR